MFIRSAIVLAAAGLWALPAASASFDCAAAKTPFEQAICDNPELSRADEILAKTYATAMGGLTGEAATLMRADQRAWLGFVQRACTRDGEPLAEGSYDERGLQCLAEKFDNRAGALEQSRMIEGHRFYIQSAYAALPDPNEVGDPDSYWPLATHEAVYPQLDGDDEIAADFNAFVIEEMRGFSDLPIGGAPGSDLEDGSDTSNVLKIKEVAGTGRITMEITGYWYGHGAAHGNYAISYLHYLVQDKRALEAGDIFSGEGWETVLRDAAWEQLQAQHAEWLYADGPDDIAKIVVDPSRWDIGDDYNFIIQFQPYEVSAYAYGAPTVGIPWESLEAIKAENQEAVRFGYISSQ